MVSAAATSSSTTQHERSVSKKTFNMQDPVFRYAIELRFYDA
jgi:hypothetical protein